MNKNKLQGTGLISGVDLFFRKYFVADFLHKVVQIRNIMEREKWSSHHLVFFREMVEICFGVITTHEAWTGRFYGLVSSAYVEDLSLICHVAVNAVPCLQILVGSTQSNISNHCSIALRRSWGVHTPIRYLGISVGILSLQNSIISWSSALVSHTESPHTAIQSWANSLSTASDSFLRSVYSPHWTIGNRTPLCWSYVLIWYSNCSRARRWVISIYEATFCFVILCTGAHTSNIIMISDQRLRCISTTHVGVNVCLDQS